MSEMTQAALTKAPTAAARTYEARAYAASDTRSGLGPATIRRREPRPLDVQLEVLFCGVCHSDLADFWKASLSRVDRVHRRQEPLG